jgi:Na+/glutamate symporter
MPVFTPFIQHYLLTAPAIVAALFLVVVLIALFRKDFVKASMWFRTCGFSIEAGNSANASNAKPKR